MRPSLLGFSPPPPNLLLPPPRASGGRRPLLPSSVGALPRRMVVFGTFFHTATPFSYIRILPSRPGPKMSKTRCAAAVRGDRCTTLFIVFCTAFFLVAAGTLNLRRSHLPPQGSATNSLV